LKIIAHPQIEQNARIIITSLTRKSECQNIPVIERSYAVSEALRAVSVTLVVIGMGLFYF
jgi:hypothetical protein